VLAKVHAGVACMQGVFQALVDRLTKSGLRQLEAGTNRPQSVIGTRRVQNNFSMFNAGLFGSDLDYGEECENIDKTRCRATSRQLEQNASWVGYMEMRSTSCIH